MGLVPDRRLAGHYMAAQFLPASATGHGALLCYSTFTEQWAVKPLLGSQGDHPWGALGVLAHDGFLW